MSRGIALSVVRALLKAELRDAQVTNSVLDTEYNYALENKQKDLCNAYDWPFMEDIWEQGLVQGDRYVNMPTTNIRSIAATINFERPVVTSVKFNTYYTPVVYGIGVEQMNESDSTQDVYQDPVRRWSMDTNVGDGTSPNQFEVWPRPASAQTFRFTGQRAPRALSSDSDVTDLDDLVIVYFVAADYLAMREMTNAPIVLKKANERLVMLRAGYPQKTSPPIVFGGQQFEERRNIKLVAIR